MDKVITVVRLINNDGLFFILRSLLMHKRGSFYSGIIFAVKEVASIFYRTVALARSSQQQQQHQGLISSGAAQQTQQMYVVGSRQNKSVKEIFEMMDEGAAPVINAPRLGFRRSGVLW